MGRSCHFTFSREITVGYCRLKYDTDFIMTRIGNGAALEAVSDGYTASLWLSITPIHLPVEVQRSFTCSQESPCQFLNTFTTVDPFVDVPSDWNKHMSNAECCFCTLAKWIPSSHYASSWDLSHYGWFFWCLLLISGGIWIKEKPRNAVCPGRIG